jgi:protein SCO1/2
MTTAIAQRLLIALLPLAAFAAGCKEDARPTCCGTEPAPAAPLPDTSVYQVTHVLRDQDGAERRLADFRGRPVLMVMMFTHCSFACPAIVADLKRVLEKLPGRGDVHVVLASMDAVRDEPAALAAFARRHALPKERYTLLQGDSFAVRELAAVLGVRFAEIEGGDFSHSNQIALLDHDGRIAFRLEGLGADPAPLIAAIGAVPAR